MERYLQCAIEEHAHPMPKKRLFGVPTRCLPSFGSTLGLVSCLALSLAGCGGTHAPDPDHLSPVAQAGEALFDERALSASGAQACSTCHNPNQAHAQTNGRATQLGGIGLDLTGLRSVPSLRYLSFAPPQGWNASGAPVGGMDWDGRAADLTSQAAFPLLARFEMANRDHADLVARLRRSASASVFLRAFGPAALDDNDRAFAYVTTALAAYQQESKAFHPFDSKYDFYLKGQVKLTAAEQHGLMLFNARDKGNCAACHPSAPMPDGGPPLFTNSGFYALGVPRNREIVQNGDPSFFDLGVCGPVRLDLLARTDLCGAFKVPSLRNVATRAVFFHNGRFSSLSDAVRFIIDRDAHPERWYPTDAAGHVLSFDDLPSALQTNVFRAEPPFNRKRGDSPALDAAELSDLLAFLATLSDGYRP